MGVRVPHAAVKQKIPGTPIKKDARIVFPEALIPCSSQETVEPCQILPEPESVN